MTTLFKYFSIFLSASLFLAMFANTALAETQLPGLFGSGFDEIENFAETGVEGPIGHWHYYWKDGFRLDSQEKNLNLKFNLEIMGDGGYISPDDEIKKAFPDLEGASLVFRELMVTMAGNLYGFADFKLQVDFANARDIKDEWIRFKNIPFIGHFTVGHIKEPFSLEELTSLKTVTFMERALPTLAFTPGRDIGITRQSAVFDERMTWAVGAFLNTGSFGSVGESKDQVSEANGWDFTARITGLPRYEDRGRNLLHLGLSYSYQVRDDAINGSQVQFRARPESRLTNDRLVDTGQFSANWVNMVNPEVAIVSGPFSFQGETCLTYVDRDTEGNPWFWGFYVFGSYFLTGENRNYKRSKGVFSQVKPNRNFHFAEEGWGAWELALRFSYIDLNDSGISGGREHNITAGLNWYLTPDTRFMFNCIRARTKDRDTPPSVDNGVAHIIQARFQMEF
jgi:phosphate-selective porin OprO/OprP